MKHYLYICLIFFSAISCRTQEKESPPGQLIGGSCEGCEAIHEYGSRTLTTVDTLPAFLENEPKLKISGTVFKKDGETPAENVILYIYHTNRKGIYETRGNEKGWGKRHGYIRGWVKTDSSGKYTFYTFRPASYPTTRAPQHIHITVKEPDKNEYYIDEFLFEDDPFLTRTERENKSNRGGLGIVRPVMEGKLQSVRRDIILGMNIPNY